MNAIIAGFTGGWEIWAICIVILILFGGAAIPKFAKSLGRAKKEFEEGIKDGKTKNDDSDDSEKKDASGDSGDSKKSD